MSTRPAPESSVDILNEITFGDVWYCLKTIPSFLLYFIAGFILVVIVLFMMTARLGKDCLALEDHRALWLGVRAAIIAGKRCGSGKIRAMGTRAVEGRGLDIGGVGGAIGRIGRSCICGWGEDSVSGIYQEGR